MSSFVGLKRRRSSRAFRPGLNRFLGEPPLEPRNLPGVAFIGLGEPNPVILIAGTDIPPADGVSQEWIQNQISGPVGGVVSSSLDNVIRRRMQFTNPYPSFVWIDQVSLHEDGTISSTFSTSATGTSAAAVMVLGSHTHTDVVTVYEGPQSVQANPVAGNAPGYAYLESTEAGGGQKSWQVADENGNFDPNWTLSVDFSLDVSAQQANFMESGVLTIATPQITIRVGFGEPGVGNGPGIQVTDGNANVLYADPTYTGGVYKGHWTVPAIPVQTVGYGSRFWSGPAGSFGVGTTVALQHMGYTFQMTLDVNP